MSRNADRMPVALVLCPVPSMTPGVSSNDAVSISCWYAASNSVA